MSQILKNLLKPEILSALHSFGSETYTGPDSPADAQEKFADVISAAIAKAVQEYLSTYVLTDPTTGSPITAPSFGPVAHIHVQLPHGIRAP